MDDPATPLDETAEALDCHHSDSGKGALYRRFRIFWPIDWRGLSACQDTLRLARFVSAQPRYNLLFREIERELLPLAQEESLAVIPFNPLCRWPP